MKKLLLLFIVLMYVVIVNGQTTTFKTDLVLDKTGSVADRIYLRGNGSLIDFMTGDLVLTQSSNQLSLSGGNLSLGANSLLLTGSVGSTGARATKLWVTDMELTNLPTIGGSSISTYFVPVARTINSKPLSSNVTITSSDVGLGNVANESKTTMFSNAVFTGTINLPASWYVGGTLISTTATELNRLSGLTVNSNEVNRLSGVTDNVQQQLNNKLSSVNATFSGLTTIEQLQIGTSDSAIVIEGLTDVGTGLTVTKDGSPITYNFPPENIVQIQDIAVMQGDLISGTDTVATRAYARGYGGSGGDILNRFNIMDYGATDGGTVEDQTAIQAAVDAAAALGAGDEMGGTVIIPAGKWYITSAVTIKNWVNIQIDDNAWFNFPSNYTGSMWSAQSGLSGCTINGGNYYLYDLTPTWNLIDLRSVAAGTAVYRNSFENMWCGNAGTVMKLTVRGDGWVNANVFSNIYVEGAGIMIDFSESAASTGMDGNMFSNCTFQFSQNYTTVGIDSMNGSWNMFSNCMFWDWEDDIPTIIMGTTSSYNIFYGGGLLTAKSRLVNLGVWNQIVSDGTTLTPFSDSLVIRDYNGSPAFVDKITLIHNGDAGSNATPAGDIAIKLKSRGDATGSNSSTRIVSRNSAGDSNAASMVFQTHGTASSDSYVDAMTLRHTGGVRLLIAGIPSYADNTAAKNAGLVDGDLYRTSTGVLMIVYTP